MDVKQLIQDYLSEAKLMQIATSVHDQPWCCSLAYARHGIDQLYWISLPESRHSQEIQINNKVSGAIVVPHDFSEGYVRGLQFQGIAKQLDGEEEAKAIELFTERFNREKTMLEDMRSGKNPHKAYKITVNQYVLFDSLNFKGNPRQELTLRD